jgi:hypothetical protein
MESVIARLLGDFANGEVAQTLPAASKAKHEL